MAEKKKKSEPKKKAKVITTMLSKISVKTVFGTIKVKEIIELKEPLKLMRVYGIAKRILTGTSDFGEWVGFGGMFQAVNKQTGENFVSGRCFLPTPVTNMLSGQFVKDIESIRFGFDISVKFNEGVTCKYEYISSAIVKMAEDNPLALLEGEIESS